MLRLKIPGGEVTAEQMRTLGQIAERYARGLPTSLPARTFSSTG
ncbi:MAG: hypothetical protein ACUVSV_14885 [Armatimonadota bacterium]